MDRAVEVSAIRTLLAGAIDYAGLFPPAALSMDEAARNYASYHDGAHSWALGRFVVPAARLGELRECTALLPAATGSPWRLAALAGPGGADDWKLVQAFAGRGVVVDALELRVRTPDDVRAAAAQLPTSLDVFYEIPIDSDPRPLVAAISHVGGKAKVRTGGVRADAFPRAADLARFIVRCAEAAVPFKATAGLHHPLRATYPLTYDLDSPRGEMFGFVNVLLAAAFAQFGLGTHAVVDLLLERSPAALRFSTNGVEWRDRRVGIDALAEARGALALSFGSCSFTEPIEELEALGLL
ncbi:MAG: hypothetical protein M3282_01320 [Gemmatimonadota bacterium]|nr:hypothetical protein [Gemmatimonadota bacterium]